MKRIIVGFALLLAPAVAVAQSPATATINTSATVKSAVSFSAPVDLDFGAAIPGASAGVTEKGVTTTSGSVGSLKLFANQSVSVTAAYSALTGPGADLTPVAACGWNSTATASSANTFACATGYTSPAGGTGATGYSIFLGGSIALPAGQLAGNYVGTATVTGTYTTY
jgi:hypothetical protein